MSGRELSRDHREADGLNTDLHCHTSNYESVYVEANLADRDETRWQQKGPEYT